MINNKYYCIIIVYYEFADEFVSSLSDIYSYFIVIFRPSYAGIHESALAGGVCGMQVCL